MLRATLTAIKWRLIISRKISDQSAARLTCHVTCCRHRPRRCLIRRKRCIFLFHLFIPFFLSFFLSAHQIIDIVAAWIQLQQTRPAYSYRGWLHGRLDSNVMARVSVSGVTAACHWSSLHACSPHRQHCDRNACVVIQNSIENNIRFPTSLFTKCFW